MKRLLLVLASLALLLVCTIAAAQNAGTGAITGLVTDSSGAAVPQAIIAVTDTATGATRTVNSAPEGNYAVQLLPPGTYLVEVTKPGFKDSKYPDVMVHVAETETLNIKLEVGSTSQTVQVNAGAEQLQTDTSSLGNVVNQAEVVSLPLVNRNYTQIVGLSAGVNTEVTNAGDFGRGNGGVRTITASGGSVMDNNFQMNGSNVNDVQQSGALSGGIPIPNPDTIQEFNVQTVAFDAAYGRDAGANVNIVTKGGTNEFHGNLFEFFRNTALDANDFFLNQNNQPREVLRQNQFGFTLGGPIVKDKLTFFASYQGTRQLNGVTAGCATSIREPALTDTNRTAAGLGALFGGQSGALGPGGGANVVQPDGSNISPQAIAFLNLKLPNGQFLIPNPQVVNSAATNPATAGSYAVSSPCPFSEDQYMLNANWNQSPRSKWAERFFFANSHEDLTLNTSSFGSGPLPGFSTSVPNHFRNVTLSNEFIITPQLLNQVVIGYNRLWVATTQATPFQWSDFGVTAPPFDTLPLLAVVGAFTPGGNGQVLDIGQNQYSLEDNLSWQRGRQTIRVGGGAERDDDALSKLQESSGLEFNTFADFLLGESGAQNGTGISNVFEATDLPGILDRTYRLWDANLYIQDDIKVTRRFTLNAGLRYERLGDVGELDGRNSNFDLALANPNPPATGSLQGYLVAGNFPGGAGALPPGVTINSGSNLAISGKGQNTFDPRLGFAWQLPNSDRFVLRGGVGVYHEAISGELFIQQFSILPWAQSRTTVDSPTITFADPFQTANVTFPSFAQAAYSPTTSLSTTSFDPRIRPPTIYHYSMNLQTQLVQDLVLQIGYVGGRDLHLLNNTRPDQALSASSSNPVRGITTNTFANIAQRVPVEGFGVNTLGEIGANASGWYNALEATLSKRFSHSLQFLAAYTWTRNLMTTTSETTGITGGTMIGNQLDPAHEYGPDSYIRPQRFVFSGIYQVPTMKNWNSFLKNVLGQWSLSGVVTIQAGDYLNITNTNTFNILGITSDFAQLSSNCTTGEVNNPGAVTNKLTNYFNKSCFTSFPVIGADGIATGFGNSRPGIGRGPAQQNVDLSLSKIIPINWPREGMNLEFRTDAFNALNTPQFADPTTAFNSATFGDILSTSVNPRIFQFALKLNF